MGLKYDILAINARCKIDAANGNKVINGCVGTYRNDKHQLVGFDTVKKNLKDFSSMFLDYSPIFGTKKYQDGILKWLFEDKYEDVSKKDNLFVAATLGGTGALYSVFKYLSKQNSVVLFSDICWPNYFSISDEAKIKYDTYPLFKNNEFNFEALAQKIDQYACMHQKVLVVINDPCQNPSGYSFVKEEYDKLFEIIEKINKVFPHKVEVLFDIAYYNYADGKPLLLDYLMNDYSYNIYVAFSCSKTFGVYGMRSGAIITFCYSAGEKDIFKESIEHITRGTFSCPNNDAIGVFGEILNDCYETEEIKKELLIEKHILVQRGIHALEIMKQYGIAYLPYHYGFFITISTKEDAYMLCEALEKEHIYVCPISDHLLRLAICSVTLEEVEIFTKFLSVLDK